MDASGGRSSRRRRVLLMHDEQFVAMPMHRYFGGGLGIVCSAS